MKSNLFDSNVEVDSPDRMSLQNPRLLRVRLDGDLLARRGSMVAYQGEVTFAFEGSGGVGKLLKKALTGEGVPLMRCSGKGDLFLAHSSYELHLIDLDDESLTVNGANVLALDPALTWDIHKIEGATLLSGDVFNMVITGNGRVVLAAWGTPVVLDASQAPTYADVQAAIAWSTSLTTTVVRTSGAKALIGRGSGEAYQLSFSGEGFVVVQASEGPVVPKHDHKSVADWLG